MEATLVRAPNEVRERAEKAYASPEEYTSLTAFRNQLAQAEHELALMQRLPEMRVQQERLRVQINHITKCVVASMAGFSQFTAPSNWKMGFFAKPKDIEGGYSLYARAVPAEALQHYLKAKALTTATYLTSKRGAEPVFSHFTVHSPDASAFTAVAPIPSTPRPPIDPIIIGWVNGNLGREEIKKYGDPTGKFNFSGSVTGDGFLIAAWNLTSDLAFLPAPSTTT